MKPSIPEPPTSDPEVALPPWLGVMTCPDDHPIVTLIEKAYRHGQPHIRVVRVVAWLQQFVKN